ncbi:MAG: ERF family protein [Weissella confusa]
MQANLDMTATAELNEDLAKMQATLVQPPFDSTGHFGKYLSLGGIDKAIRTAIKAANVQLSYQMEIRTDTDANAKRWMYVITYIRHSSGEVIAVNGIPVEFGQTPQTTLANVTYAKRGSLAAAFGVVADSDDDGEQISEIQRQKNKQEEIRVAIVAKLKETLAKVPKEKKAMVLSTAKLTEETASTRNINKLDSNKASLLLGAAMFATSDAMVTE